MDLLKSKSLAMMSFYSVKMLRSADLEIPFWFELIYA